MRLQFINLESTSFRSLERNIRVQRVIYKNDIFHLTIDTLETDMLPIKAICILRPVSEFIIHENTIKQL